MRRIIEVRPGVYHDSVTLMQLSGALISDEAVAHAQVAMGTALNLDLLVEIGYERPEAGSGDLVIALETDDDETAAPRFVSRRSSVAQVFDETAAIVRFCSEHCPGVRPLVIDGQSVHLGGGDAVLEVAYTIASLIECQRHLAERAWYCGSLKICSMS